MEFVRVPHLETYGYGSMAANLIRSMRRRGVEMSWVREGGPSVPATALFMQLPATARGAWAGQRRVLLTMFETSELPHEFVEPLGRYDTVLVPCEANRRTFARHHPDVRTIPLGVDPERWHFTERPPADPFTFLTVGARWWYRKGLDLVLDAFQALRDELVSAGEPRPRLMLHPGAPDAAGTLRERSRDDPDVVWLNGKLIPAAEVQLSEMAHCYVSGSRGEGWGLCPHQAIAQGCPTILADAAGQHEFARYGTPIGWHQIAATEYGDWRELGHWWEPDADELLAAMRLVYTSYDQAQVRAAVGATEISGLTWDNAAARLLEELGDLGEIPAGEWRAFPEISTGRS